MLKSKVLPILSNYQTQPIEIGFDWKKILNSARGTSFYLVVFRSKARKDADTKLLHEYDKRALSEATKAGGLIYYFSGQINEKGECLSWCIWDDMLKAKTASTMPDHSKAMSIANTMYEFYNLERYAIRDGTFERL